VFRGRVLGRSSLRIGSADVKPSDVVREGSGHESVTDCSKETVGQ
jgi:hypothetical protein